MILVPLLSTAQPQVGLVEVLLSSQVLIALLPPVWMICSKEQSQRADSLCIDHMCLSTCSSERGSTRCKRGFLRKDLALSTEGRAQPPARRAWS